MAQMLLNNVSVIINSVDLSSRIDDVSVEETYADVDTTTFGNTAKRRIAGLGDNKVTLEFQQDFAAASVEATIGPLVGTIVPVDIKPLSGVTSSTNPAYSFNALINDWKPLSGKVGEIPKISVTWPIDGTITKAVA